MPRCPECNSSGVSLQFKSPDRIFNISGDFSLYYCKVCALSFIWPQPSPQVLTRHYPENYEVYSDFTSTPPNNRKLRGFIFRKTLGFFFNYGPRHFWQFIFLPYVYRVAHYPSFIKHGNVLDVGCGNGRLLADLERLGWQGQGIDMSEQAVAIAKKHGLNVQVGTLPNKSLPSGVFDAVILHHVLEHLPEPKVILGELYRLLKPGGQLIITVPNTRSLMANIFGSNWFSHEIPRHIFGYTAYALKRLLRDTKFVPEHIIYAGFLESLPQSLGLCYPYLRSASRLGAIGRVSNVVGLLLGPVADILRIADTITIRARKT